MMSFRWTVEAELVPRLRNTSRSETTFCRAENSSRAWRDRRRARVLEPSSNSRLWGWDPPNAGERVVATADLPGIPEGTLVTVDGNQDPADVRAALDAAMQPVVAR